MNYEYEYINISHCTFALIVRKFHKGMSLFSTLCSLMFGHTWTWSLVAAQLVRDKPGANITCADAGDLWFSISYRAHSQSVLASFVFYAICYHRMYTDVCHVVSFSYWLVVNALKM